MQSTTRRPARVANAVLQEASPALHPPVACHPTERVFETDAERCERTRGRVRRWRECPAPRCVLGWDAGAPLACHARKAQRVRATTPGGQGIAGPIRQALSRSFPRLGVAQAAQTPGRVAHQPVGGRGALWRAAGGVLRVRWSGRARPAGPKGGVGRGPVVGRAGWPQLWVCSGLRPHGLEAMKLRLGVRLGQPNALARHRWQRMWCQGGQEEAPGVGPRGARPLIIRTGAAARAGVSITGAVPPRGDPRVLARGQQRRACWLGSSRHRPETPGTWGDLLIAWPRHLRHSVSGREA
jgi:hypothetical protein